MSISKSRQDKVNPGFWLTTLRAGKIMLTSCPLCSCNKNYRTSFWLSRFVGQARTAACWLYDVKFSYLAILTSCYKAYQVLACKQALWDALVAGWEKEGELELRLWNLNSASNFPVAPQWLSCQISTNQHKVGTSMNVNRHWKTSAKCNDIITGVISANQHFA